MQIAIRQGTTPRGDGAKPSVAESITKREERESTREPDGELIKAENKKWVAKIYPNNMSICDCQLGSSQIGWGK